MSECPKYCQELVLVSRVDVVCVEVVIKGQKVCGRVIPIKSVTGKSEREEVSRSEGGMLWHGCAIIGWSRCRGGLIVSQRHDQLVVSITT